jgi:hypothetical protein
MDAQLSASGSVADSRGALARSLRLAVAGAQKLVDRVRAAPQGITFMTGSEVANDMSVNDRAAGRIATALGLHEYPGPAALCRKRLQELYCRAARELQEIRGIGGPGASDTAGSAPAGSQAHRQPVRGSAKHFEMEKVR